MVILIPSNDNPSRADIDAFIRNTKSSADYKEIVREIECKSNVGALLHPAEEYFLEAIVSHERAYKHNL
jgi:hypothetical protein